MRVEYAKTRARALRWSEEVYLVKEEMRRVLEFFNWKMNWWAERASHFGTRLDTIAVGFIIYANRQISVLERIGQRFKRLWEEECSIKDLPHVGGTKLTSISNIFV